MPRNDKRDWSTKQAHYPNTDSAIRWMQGRYSWLARQYKRYQVPHGEHAPYLTIEHYINVERAHPSDRKRAAGYQHHRELRASYKTGRLRQRDDYDAVKDTLMWEALCFKFSLNGPDQQLRLNLIATYPRVQLIVDTNVGCENYWGSCICPKESCRNTGQNVYGRMLLKVREHVLKGEL